MNSFIRFLIAAACLSLPAFSAAGALGDIHLEHSKFKLSNGLTVLVAEDNSVSTVFVGVWYKVGSRDETQGRTGFAHLTEQLMFSGSKHSDVSYFEPIRAVGGILRGAASRDRTAYYQSVPANALERVLWLEADRMGFLADALTQQKLDEQREVVQKEKRRSLDSSAGVRRYAVAKALYPIGHPYRWLPIGSMDDLNAASLEDIKQFISRHYRPNNAILTVAGNTTVAEVRRLAEKYFGGLEPGPQNGRQLTMVPYRPYNTAETLYNDINSPTLSRHWVVPGYSERDYHLILLLGDILTTEDNSWLKLTLIKQQGLASAVQFWGSDQQLASEINLQITLNDGAPAADVTAAIDAVLKDFIQHGPSEEQLKLAKLRAENRLVRQSLVSASARGAILAQGELGLGNPSFYKSKNRWLEDATAADLQSVARRWLATGYHQIEQRPQPIYRAQPVTLDRSSMPELGPELELTAPEIHRATLANGISVNLIENHSLPLIDGDVLIGNLLAYSGDRNPAAARTLANLMKMSTSKLDENQFKTALLQAGMTLTGHNGVDYIRMRSSFLKSRMSTAANLLNQALRDPGFRQSTFSPLQSRRIASQQSTESSINQSYLHLSRILFGAGHPYEHLSSLNGSSTQLQQLSLQDVQDLHREWVIPANIRLYFAGDTSMDELLPVLEASIGKWRSSVNSRSAPEIPALQWPPGPRVVLFDKPGARQTLFRLGALVPFTNSLADLPLQALNNIYGGDISSRLVRNLREEKGWSYSVDSRLTQIQAQTQTQWHAGGRVQADKTLEAMQETWRELVELDQIKPVSAAELSTYVSNQTKRLPATLGSNPARINYMLRIDSMGESDDLILKQAQALNALSLQDLQMVRREYLQPEEMVWVVTGDLDRIEQDIRNADFGKVEVWNAGGERIR